MTLRSPLFIILMIVAVSLWLAGASHGHGDARWIQEGHYKGDDDALCCGVLDCQKAPPEAIEQIQEGWRIVPGVHFTFGTEANVTSAQIMRTGQRGLHQSEDNNFWWCIKWLGGNAHVRCLFVRQAGT